MYVVLFMCTFLCLVRERGPGRLWRDERIKRTLVRSEIETCATSSHKTYLENLEATGRCFFRYKILFYLLEPLRGGRGRPRRLDRRVVPPTGGANTKDLDDYSAN